MQNIEIKTPLHSRVDTERRLQALGARRVWTRRQKDTFFGVPNGWLKLREAGAEPAELISYRRSAPEGDGILDGLRASDYDVLPVGDAESWKRLLGRVLPVETVVEKERTLWLYEHTRIHLDRVARLGEYLELETVVRDIPPEEARAETRRVIDALSLREHEFIHVPYRELLEGRR